MSRSIQMLALLISQGLAYSIPSNFAGADMMKRQDGCYSGEFSQSTGDYICTTYCETSTAQITGAAVNISGHITCDTTSCPAAVSQTYTSTQSFTINIGGEAGADESFGEDSIKGGASAGASWSWSSSSATSNTYTFTLSEGDAGNIVFRPYYHQSCGDLKYFGTSYNSDDTVMYCDDTPYAEDTNACGQTPLLGSTGFADGDFTFCYTDGPKAGQGC